MSHKQAKLERRNLRAQGVDTRKPPKVPTRHHIAKSDLRNKQGLFEVTMAATFERLLKEGFVDENGHPTEKGLAAAEEHAAEKGAE